MKGTSGFTLLELMIGVAIAVILLTVGIPSFTSSVKQNQAASDANSLLMLLNLARSEAIKRVRTVTLCISNDGSSCDTSSSANWTEGYLLYYLPPGSTSLTTLKTEVPFSNSSSISATSAFASAVSFNGLGSAGSVDASNHFTAATGTFTVLPNNLPSSLKNYTRCVTIYPAGRVYIKNADPTTFLCS